MESPAVSPTPLATASGSTTNSSNIHVPTAVVVAIVCTCTTLGILVLVVITAKSHGLIVRKIAGLRGVISSDHEYKDETPQRVHKVKDEVESAWIIANFVEQTDSCSDSDFSVSQVASQTVVEVELHGINPIEKAMEHSPSSELDIVEVIWTESPALTAGVLESTSGSDFSSLSSETVLTSKQDTSEGTLGYSVINLSAVSEDDEDGIC